MKSIWATARSDVISYFLSPASESHRQGLDVAPHRREVMCHGLIIVVPLAEGENLTPP